MLQVPTDSFYKFLAVGGMLLVVLSVFVMDREQARANEATDAFVRHAEMRRFVLEPFVAESGRIVDSMRVVQDSINAAGRRQKQLLAEGVALNDSAGGLGSAARARVAREAGAQLDRSLEEGARVRSLVAVSEDLSRRFDLNRSQMSMADSLGVARDLLLARAERANDRALWLGILALVFAVLGLIISGLGFRLWYVRLQRIQDYSARLEAWRKQREML